MRKTITLGAAVAAVLAIAPPALASTAVTPENANKLGWYISTNSSDGKAEFVGTPQGQPETAPLGVAALRLFTGTNGDKVSAAVYGGTQAHKLGTLKKLSYYSLVKQAPVNRAPFLIMGIDLDGNPNTQEDALAFTPGGPNGEIKQNTWQRFNAVSGTWFGRGFRGGIGDYERAHPTARVLYIGTFFGAGTKQQVFDGQIDAFEILYEGKENTFDFETKQTSAPATPPDDCTLRLLGICLF